MAFFMTHINCSRILHLFYCLFKLFSWHRMLSLRSCQQPPRCSASDAVQALPTSLQVIPPHMLCLCRHTFPRSHTAATPTLCIPIHDDL